MPRKADEEDDNGAAPPRRPAAQTTPSTAVNESLMEQRSRVENDKALAMYPSDDIMNNNNNSNTDAATNQTRPGAMRVTPGGNDNNAAGTMPLSNPRFMTQDGKAAPPNSSSNNNAARTAHEDGARAVMTQRTRAEMQKDSQVLSLAPEVEAPFRVSTGQLSSDNNPANVDYAPHAGQNDPTNKNGHIPTEAFPADPKAVSPTNSPTAATASASAGITLQDHAVVGAPPVIPGSQAVSPSWQTSIEPPDRGDMDNNNGNGADIEQTTGVIVQGAVVAPPREDFAIVLENITQQEEEHEEKSRRLGRICLAIAALVAVATGIGVVVALTRPKDDPVTPAPTPLASMAPSVSAVPSMSPSTSPTMTPWRLLDYQPNDNSTLYVGTENAHYFGRSVAMRGEILAMSGPGVNSNTGIVRVRNRLTGEAVGQDIVGSIVGEMFGTKLALSADATRLAILSMGSTGTGAVYIYDYSTTMNNNRDWGRTATIDETAVGGSNFGTISSIALSSNGKVLAIMASAVHVFDADTTTNTIWTARSVLELTIFGKGFLSLSGDGRYLLATHDGSKVPHLFQYNSGAKVWLVVTDNDEGTNRPQDELFVQQPDGGAVLSDDGTLFVLGDDTGFIQVYTVDQRLRAFGIRSDPIVLDSAPQDSGFRMSLALEGSNVAVAFQRVFDPQPRAAVFVRDGQNWRLSGEQIIVQAESSALGALSCSITNNGTLLAIGLPQSIVWPNAFAGEVEVYQLL